MSETSTVSTITPSSVTSTTAAALPSHSDLYTTPTKDPDDSSNNTGLVNYYFVFIGLAFILVFFASWALLRKRRRARIRALTHRHTVLHRDVADSGAGAARGWTYAGRDGFGLGALMRREGRGGRENDHEGLDERGEAPPPYKPRDEEEGAAEGGIAHTETATLEAANAPGLAVPMRTLGREQVGLKPPDYSEAVAREMEMGREHEERDEAGRGSSVAASAPTSTTPETERRT